MTYFNLSFPADGELHEDRIHAALRAAQEPGQVPREHGPDGGATTPPEGSQSHA